MAFYFEEYQINISVLINNFGQKKTFNRNV